MKTIRYCIILILSCLLLTQAEAANYATKSIKEKQHARLWNLQNADILSIIHQVSIETGKNFVVDPRVSGKISLVSSHPVPPEQIYDIFLSALNLLGYSAIPEGPITKIIPNMESSEAATAIQKNHRQNKNGEVVVQIIPLKHASANQLIPVIRPMLPQWSNVAAYTPGNVLVLIGHKANLARINQVIHKIETSAGSDIEIIPLKQASASQLTNILSRLQRTSRISSMNNISIASDDRSNSILLSGNAAARMHYRYLINKLDIAGKHQGNTEVIYLRYLQAKNFAPLLGRIAQNMQNKKALGATETITSTTSSSATDVNNHDTKATPLINSTNIQAELTSNAIIITAPPDLMHALRLVVGKLDIRPAQVLVEGIIVEVNQDNLQNLGIQWGTLIDKFSQQAATTAATSFPIPGAGNIGIIPHTDIAAILSFLEARNDTDILSTPSISVLDNQKAVLEIGQEVPYTTGSYATTGNTNTATPFNTTQGKPVTLKLTVTPQINLGNAVRLKIDLKNDSLQNPDTTSTNPIINTSSIKNSVIINSQDVLVLGGLIKNSSTDHINKVPLLGDLPIVGKALFQQKNHKITKKNLLVFIKPTILHNDNDSNIITESKYENIRREQIIFPQNLRSNTQQHAPHILPLWKNNIILPNPFSSEYS